jgi:hypothetical protein
MEKDASTVIANKIEQSPSAITSRFLNDAHISSSGSGFLSQVSSNPFFTAVSWKLPSKIRTF